MRVGRAGWPEDPGASACAGFSLSEQSERGTFPRRRKKKGREIVCRTLQLLPELPRVFAGQLVSTSANPSFRSRSALGCSALGLRPRRGALRLLRSSLRSPNLVASGDRRILPSLRSALTSFGGYVYASARWKGREGGDRAFNCFFYDF